jgi:hypothetical protein
MKKTTITLYGGAPTTLQTEAGPIKLTLQNIVGQVEGSFYVNVDIESFADIAATNEDQLDLLQDA